MNYDFFIPGSKLCLITLVKLQKVKVKKLHCVNELSSMDLITTLYEIHAAE